MSLPERYWAKVDRRGPNDCWPWTGALTKGYGVISVGSPERRLVAAHRVGYELAKGPIPEGFDVDHECHNTSGCTDVPCAHRACQNPAHLAAKTRRDNLAASPNTVVSKAIAVGPCEHGLRKSRCKDCIRIANHEYQKNHRQGRVRSRA